MPAHKTLYLLRRPISDPAQSLLPSASAEVSSGVCSLVLLEEAVGSSPAFPGPIYVLPSASGSAATAASGKIISYRELVGLIAEHDSTIVL
ncbi:MAG: hypothetical protein IPI70_01750 [Nitrospira sp.]|nr:hypothetical protein [Nitrospira sp.]